MFFTIFTFVRFPTTSLPRFNASPLRTSIRTEEKNFNARPPVVVSGFPYITPIFSRTWLIKIIVVLFLLILAVILRKACDIRRARSPTWESPISPSISARGVSAATESTTIISTAPLRASASQISNACSP